MLFYALSKRQLKQDDSVTIADEKQLVRHLVEAQIVDHWESRDEPEHLRTIRDRLLFSEQSRELLLLYRRILRGEKVSVSNQLEQLELRLTGLVVKKDGELVVSNPIYRTIFDAHWVEQQLQAQLPPETYRISGVSDLWDRLIEDEP